MPMKALRKFGKISVEVLDADFLDEIAKAKGADRDAIDAAQTLEDKLKLQARNSWVGLADATSIKYDYSQASRGFI